MMSKPNFIQLTKTMLLASVLGSGLLVPRAQTQSQESAAKPSPPVTSSAAVSPYRYQPNPVSRRARVYYGLIWGVDSLGVRLVESGEIVRFSYRVLDPQKAKTLNDKKLEPSLIDPEARVKLVVPSLDQVGLLRQSAIPEAGKSYWMAFSNKGGVVKRGDKVDVVVGQFRADGLVVE